MLGKWMKNNIEFSLGDSVRLIGTNVTGKVSGILVTNETTKIKVVVSSSTDLWATPDQLEYVNT